jgi:hypothetical protein
MTVPKTLTPAISPGNDAIQVAAKLLNALPSGSMGTFAEVTIPPAAQQRLTSMEKLQPLISKALKLRQDYGVSFWMALMYIAELDDHQLPPELLRAASFHQPMANAETRTVATESITADTIRAWAATTSPGRILVLSSKIVLPGNRAVHIPMLDFRVRSSLGNQRTAELVISQLNAAGWLLDSGQSYHFYGAQLLADDQLRTFLTRALFFTPIVDYRWIAHQLLENACALRIAPGGHAQKMPELVSTIRTSP